MGITVRVTSAEWMVATVIADILDPPPSVDYLAWAEDNIVFSKRESPLPGPYSRERFSYFNEILTALSPDDPCRIVTLAKSAQLGGTVLANIFTGGSMDMDPGDFLYVHPTEENARRWSKMKLGPMLKGTTSLRRIFPMKARDGQDSVFYKERRDGRGAIQISGANSPASLSQVSMSRQVQDDLAKWDMNSAGDPETQADSRSQGYEFAKIFKISTPMVVPGCRITKNFEDGSQEYLYLPCPHDECGHMQTLEWENMLASLDEEHPERAHFTCEACGAAIEEHHRAKMLKGGEWRAANPKMKRVHRSFHIWSAYSLLQSFERIARSWLAAKGDPPREQTFMNDVVGRAYRVLGEAPPWEDIRDRASQSDYARGSIPAGFPLVTCGVDCQGDRVEWQVVAWGTHRRRAVIEYGVFNGHISEERCQQQLDALLKQGFRNAYGRKLEIDALAIDGNAYTEEVWEWARRHPAARVIMVRGVHPETAPLLAQVKRERNRRGKLLRYSKRFFNFASSVLKMGLYRNLKKDDPEERGFIALPRGLEDEYFRQLTAETRKAQKAKSGFTRWLWVKDPNQANEGLDTHLQAEAAAIRLGVRSLQDAEWDALLAARDSAPDAVQGDFEDLLMPAAQVQAAPPEAPAEEAPEAERPSTFEAAKAKWKRRRR
ncbi:phage terminase large subunit family protein [Pseudooceanicola sp. CBS1P-1]|uniref:Terminase n=1 Tax=Pseudooceanicola albus TaxID=2692189 RepID=A0A6L7FYI5_9RHOB|nr:MULTISPECIES: terminase gpA endonuclease subunit [Pseudooceanicola]MBT9383317.1 phage terminase large subunit family protein [Pseudooceanicola endophyticus]MXN16360.1 terminase [Pseudooceanicola albus]